MLRTDYGSINANMASMGYPSFKKAASFTKPSANATGLTQDTYTPSSSGQLLFGGKEKKKYGAGFGTITGLPSKGQITAARREEEAERRAARQKEREEYEADIKKAREEHLAAVAEAAKEKEDAEKEFQETLKKKEAEKDERFKQGIEAEKERRKAFTPRTRIADAAESIYHGLMDGQKKLLEDRRQAGLKRITDGKKDLNPADPHSINSYLKRSLQADAPSGLRRLLGPGDAMPGRWIEEAGEVDSETERKIAAENVKVESESSEPEKASTVGGRSTHRRSSASKASKKADTSPESSDHEPEKAPPRRSAHRRSSASVSQYGGEQRPARRPTRQQARREQEEVHIPPSIARMMEEENRRRYLPSRPKPKTETRTVGTRDSFLDDHSHHHRSSIDPRRLTHQQPRPGDPRTYPVVSKARNGDIVRQYPGSSNKYVFSPDGELLFKADSKTKTIVDDYRD